MGGGGRIKSENEGMKGDNESRNSKKKMKKEETRRKRSDVHVTLKHQKKLKARDAVEKRALERGEEPPPKQIPRTIENTREADKTVRLPDDEELFAGNDADEFSSILKHDRTPTWRFNSTIVEYANNKEFKPIIVVHTDRREPDALLIIGLPDGPTAHFKLSSLVLRRDIKNHGNPTSHKPELVLNNFTTRLDHCIGRYIFETEESKKTDSKGKKQRMPRVRASIKKN